jgi:solute:Na+ symporter, SSS family
MLTDHIVNASNSLSGLEIFDFVVVVLYIVATLAIVYRASRHQHNTDDFFLGSRRMPWMAVGLSIMATLLSSLTYLGLTGEIVKNGIAGFMTQAAVLPAAPLVVFLFIPFFMRLRFTSAYEYLEQRFDRRARVLGSVLFFLLRLLWVSMVMYSGSFALAKMGGWDFYATIAVLGIAATLYTYFGGLEGVVWTDVIQAVMLFGGAAAIVVYVWLDTGSGPLVWWQVAGEHSAAHRQAEWFSLDPTKRITLGTALMSGFFWQICTHCSDQVVLQRYASTPSVAAARNSYITNVIALLAITSLLGVSGLALLYYYLQHPDRLPAGATATSSGDELMPHFYATQLPLGFGGLILANFLCDAMQTLVSGVNSITAVATQDVLQHGRVVPKDGGSRLNLARLLTLLLGAVTTLIALVVAWLAHSSAKNIFDLMPKTFNMFIGPLGSLFLIGMFVPRATGRTATPAVLGSVAVSVIWNYWKEILEIPIVWQFASHVFEKPFDLSIMWSYAVACLSGVFFGVVLSLVVEKGGDHPGRQFTWWSVMQRPLPEIQNQKSII